MTTEKLSEQQIALLKKPLTPEAVKPHPTKDYLSTIKPIYVVERLNEVFGIGKWYMKNEVVEHDTKMVIVKSTFTVPEYGIEIENFGGNDNADKGDAYKGACSDALTKIASYLEIGMDVYKGLADKGKKKAPSKPEEDRTSPQDDLPSLNYPVPKYTATCPKCGEVGTPDELAKTTQYGAKFKLLCSSGHTTWLRPTEVKTDYPDAKPEPLAF